MYVLYAYIHNVCICTDVGIEMYKVWLFIPKPYTCMLTFLFINGICISQTRGLAYI